MTDQLIAAAALKAESLYAAEAQLLAVYLTGITSDTRLLSRHHHYSEGVYHQELPS